VAAERGKTMWRKSAGMDIKSLGQRVEDPLNNIHFTVFKNLIVENVQLSDKERQNIN